MWLQGQTLIHLGSVQGLTHSYTLTLAQTYHLGMMFAAVGSSKMSPGGV
jgi:hypothetical protein